MAKNNNNITDLIGNYLYMVNAIFWLMVLRRLSNKGVISLIQG